MEDFVKKYKTHLRGLPKSRTRLIYINTREDEEEEVVIMKIQRVQASYSNEKQKRREKYKQMKTLLEKAEATQKKADAEEAYQVASLALERAHNSTTSAPIQKNEREKATPATKSATIQRSDRQKTREETLKKDHENRLKEAERTRQLMEEREAIKIKEREYAVMRERARNEEETPEPVEGMPSKHEPLQYSPNISRQIKPVHIDDDIREYERLLYSNDFIDIKAPEPSVLLPRDRQKEPEPKPEPNKSIMTADMVKWDPRLNKRLSKIGWFPDEIKEAIYERINSIIKKTTTETDKTRNNSYYFKVEPQEKRNMRLIQNGIDSVYRHFYELLDTYERKARRGRYIPCEHVCRMINP